MAPADDDLADSPSRMFALVKPLIAVLCLLGGFFGISAGLSSSDLSVVESAAAETAAVYHHVDDQTASIRSFQLVTKAIKDIQPGMRVLADNPLEETFANPIDPDTWRQLELQLEKPNGDVMKITLLRPVDQYPDIAVGQFIELDLEEMGVSGPALLQAIKPCPPLADGEGQIVTGKFEHPSADVIDVLIEGEPEPLGTTASHPFFSQDRNAFIPAGELLVGERLQTEDGRTVRVQQITQRSSKHTVFNIEVNVEHVYHVGKNGILVHNTCFRTRNTAGPSARTTHDVFVKKVRPGAKEKVFQTPWSQGKGLGSRKFDDFDELTGTAFEGNTTPWTKITHEQLSRKLDQVGSDFALLKTNPDVKRVVWFGTEELPTTGLGAQLRDALQEAGIPYWVITP